MTETGTPRLNSLVTEQKRLGITAGVLVAAVWIYFPVQWLPVMLAIALLGLALAYSAPTLIWTLLIVFGVFKLEEVVPLFATLRLPLAIMSLAVFAMLASLSSGLSKPVWDVSLKLLLSFFIFALVSALFARAPVLAFSELQEYAKVVFLTFVVAWLPRSLRRIQAAAATLIFFGAIVALMACINKFLGIDLVEETRAKIGTGFLGNPNDLSLVLMIPLGLCCSVALFSNSRKARVFAWICAPVLILGINSTQSRGGWLFGMISVFGVVGLLKVRRKAIFVFSLPLLALVLSTMMGLSERVSGGEADVQQASAMIRTYAWRAAVSMAASLPTGVGFHNFVPEFSNYTPVQVGNNYTAHSIWFQVLGETGFIGLLLFVVMIGATAMTTYRLFRSESVHETAPGIRAYAVANLSGLAGICVSGSFASMAYNWPIYYLLGCTACLQRLTELTDVRRCGLKTPRQTLSKRYKRSPGEGHD